MIMEQKFASADTELSNLEQDFASGEMNAFGSRENQHEFFASYKRLANLETEVFYKTCSILQVNKVGEQGAFKNVVSVTTDHGNLDNSQRSADTSTNLGATDNGTAGVGNGSFSATFRHNNRFNAQWMDRNASDDDGHHADDGIDDDQIQDQDKAFVNVSRFFQVLESEFAVLSDNLHAISKEVIQIDAMAEKINNMDVNAQFDRTI